MTRTIAMLACLLLPVTTARAQTPIPAMPTPKPAPAPAPAAPLPAPREVVPFPSPMLPEAFPELRSFEWERLDASRAQERANAEIERALREADRQAGHVELWLAHEAPEMKFALAEVDAQIKAIAPVVSDFKFSPTGEGGAYRSGLQALGRHQYDRAITLFDQVVAKKDTRADGALYWKAFAEFKAGRPAESQAALAALRRDFPASRYLTEAKVLDAEIRRQAGQPMNVDDQAVNDDIKILAIQSMQRTDPERALPLLEGVLNSANSLEVKRRAVYVLALSDDPRGRQILLRYAKGAGSPDLQLDAIRYLASRRDRAATGADLREIYESTQDPEVRRVVIDAYRAAGDKPALQAVSANPTNPRALRQTAISGLSNLAAAPELMALYRKESDPVLRAQIASALASMGAIDQLAEIARTDQDATVRQRAVRGLGVQRSEQTGQTLIAIYGGSQERATREAVLQALGQQNNADGLVALARKETNLDLKRQIVSQLSSLAAKSPAAADYMMEMLKP